MTSLKSRLKRSLEQKESRLLADEYEIAHAPIFIIAPPRSGSTLLYQCMTTAFRASYTSNLMQRFSYCPVLFARLAPRALAFNPRSRFDSDYGHVRGFAEPSDGYALWSRWFPESPQFLEPGMLAPSTLRQMRQTILGIQHFSGAPFINKSQRNALRASVISECLPESVFVRLKRSHPDLALSLYKAHRAHKGGDWFSIRPRRFDLIRSTECAVERAVLHAAYSEIDISAQLARIGREQVIELSYEELCLRPHQSLAYVESRYHDLGWHLDANCRIPDAFPLSRAASGKSPDVDLIHEYIDKHAQLFTTPHRHED